MSLEAADCLLVIEEWFAKQCDRLWENFYGVTIESTDNPCWLVVVSGSTANVDKLSPLLHALMSEHQAQCTYDNTSLRVFAPTLRASLAATAIILTHGGFGIEKLSAPVVTN